MEVKARIRLVEVSNMDDFTLQFAGAVSSRINDVEERTLRGGDHMATGDLLASSYYDRAGLDYDDHGVSVDIVYLIRDSGAAWALEQGTKPHCPPFHEIYRWAVAKGRCGSEDECKAFAFRVRNKICAEGNKAYGWLSEFLEELGVK